MRTPGWMLLLAFAVLTVIPANGQYYRIRQSNTHYEPGDWTTWSVTRFVRHVSIGQQYIYFSTTGGIARYDIFKEQWAAPFTISDGLADQNIFVTAFDPATGNLWCIRETGISYREPASQYWYNDFYDEMGFDLDEHAIAIGFGNHQVYLQTGNDNIYISPATSLSFFQDQNISDAEAFKANSDIQWYSRKVSQRRNLEYMFMDDGYFFDENSHIIKDVDLRTYTITDWVYDAWNKVWITTWGLGAARGDVYSKRLNLLPYGLWDMAVDAITVEEDQYWLGGIQDDEGPSGVTRWDPKTGDVRYYEAYLLTGFDNADITSIALDDQMVWFGTRNGLLRYDRKRNSWRTMYQVDNLADDFVYDVAADGNRIWAATAEGVSYMEKNVYGEYPKKMTLLNYPALRNTPVYDIELQQNLVWLATEYGIYVHDTVTDSGGFYSGDIGPEDHSTYAVSVFGDQVWFGTETGVEAFDSFTNKWLNPPARLYETGAAINRILAAKDAVWVATDQGVLKFDRERNYWVQYTMEDGLPSDVVLSLHLDGDYIWFGTDNGLTRFHWKSPYRID